MTRLPLFLVFLAPVLVAAQNPAPPPANAAARRVAHAVRRTGDIHLDGKLDEPDWARAPAITDFTQQVVFSYS